MTQGVAKGKKQLGIYEIDGDTFKSCFGKPGDERPADFTTSPRDGRTLSVWKRKTAAPSAAATSMTFSNGGSTFKAGAMSIDSTNVPMSNVTIRMSPTP